VNITRSFTLRQKTVGQHRLMAILAMLAIMLTALAHPVTATGQERIVALGESNDESQRAEVLRFLDATESDQVVTVTVDETVQAMDGVFDLAGIDTAYSSTALTCDPVGTGITVSTRNIEVIPPELYALTLLTAGMSDVQLAVAAPDNAPALGMTAMTGVFKTWQLASCPGSTFDLARQRLALEELALISGIGSEPEPVRQLTQVVLEAQQAIIGQQVAPDAIEAMVASRFRTAGVTIDADDQARIVEFFGRLSTAEIDWGMFATGWASQSADNGSGVVLTAYADTGAPSGRDSGATGVGGATGPIPVAATPTAPDAPASPVAMNPIATNVAATATPMMAADSISGVAGAVAVTKRTWSEVLRWWPVAASVLAILLASLLVLGFTSRRRSRLTTTAWYVARSRDSRRERPVRHSRPVTVQPFVGHRYLGGTASSTRDSMPH